MLLALEVLETRQAQVLGDSTFVCHHLALGGPSNYALLRSCDVKLQRPMGNPLIVILVIQHAATTRSYILYKAPYVETRVAVTSLSLFS